MSALFNNTVRACGVERAFEASEDMKRGIMIRKSQPRGLMFVVISTAIMMFAGVVAGSGGPAGALVARIEADFNAAVSMLARERSIKGKSTFKPMLIPYLKNLPLETGSARLTRCRVDKRMFYYVQFLHGTRGETDRGVEQVAGALASPVWLTVMVGSVPDGGEGFVFPRGLYLSLDGPLYGEAVCVGESGRWFSDFREALGLIERRLATDVRGTLAEIERWLDDPVGYAPLPNRELRALQELQRLEAELFGE